MIDPAGRSGYGGALANAVILQLPIPAPDPIPLPAPVWLLKFLLLFTFVLHILAMNLALGGGVLAAVNHWRGRKKKSSPHRRLARTLGEQLPVALALTITLGIAPLLFVQVLYGQFFYTSSILLGWWWLGTLGFLLVGYYGYYWYNFRWEKLGDRGAWVITASVLVLSAIPAIFTTNVTLMLQPERWQAMVAQGLHGNWSDPAVLPRYLHFLTAAVAVAGLSVFLYGLATRGREAEYGRWVQRTGGAWFIGATLVQYGVGVWFLLSLPRNIWTLFLGERASATAVLLTAIFLSLVAIILVLVSMMAARPTLPGLGGVVALMGTVSLMAVARDIVRDAYLAPYFRASDLAVVPQWSVVLLFVALLVAGLGVVGYLLRMVYRGRGASYA